MIRTICHECLGTKGQPVYDQVNNREIQNNTGGGAEYSMWYFGS